MLQALGLLGGSAPVLVGPQTILDRLISFIAATLKKFDQAIFGSGEEVPLQPTAPLQRATTIEERERKARGESETDTGIPLSEKEGPTTGRG